MKNTLLISTLLITGALLSGCGGGGGDSTSSASASSSSSSTPSPSTFASSNYNLVAEIAAIRAHASYGAVFRATSNPDAPNGLVLPTPPQANCMANVVTVNNLTDFNTEAAGSCKRIILSPSSTARMGSAHITGQDIEAVFTGTTITPTDGDQAALQITGGAARVKTIGGTFNNLYLVGGNVWSPGGSLPNFVRDVHISGASFTGLFTQGLSNSILGDGADIRAHRFLLEHVSARGSQGTFFISPGSTNVILANSNLVVPKLTRGNSSSHENPMRANGSDLVVLIDSRLRTELGPGQSGPIKHTWRMHAGYDGAGVHGARMIVKRVQSEGGGASAQYPGVEGPNRQSTQLVVDGWRYYRAPTVEGNNIASFPYLNTDAGSAYFNTVMNAWLWMNDNIVYHTDLNFPAWPVPASNILTSNIPPGSVTQSVYQPYVAPPVWDFQ